VSARPAQATTKAMKKHVSLEGDGANGEWQVATMMQPPTPPPRRAIVAQPPERERERESGEQGATGVVAHRRR